MSQKRVAYFDLLNIFAALSVVFLHANGAVHTFSNTLAWKQALGIEVICYWAVPVFFMLSGANLMNYRQRYSTALFFKKRLIKIIIPFIVWTLFYAVLFRVNPFKTGLRDFFSRCFNTGILSTFWFFIPLLAIYLAMPILSLLKDNRRILWYMFGVSFCLISLLPSLFTYLGLAWNYALAPIMSSGYLIYAILGYLLATAEVSKGRRIAIYVLAVFSLLLRYFATLLLSQRDGTLNRLFFDYLQYHTVFLAAGVFLLFKHSKVIDRLSKNDRFIRIIKTLSGLSFGVYLIHQAVIIFLQRFIDPTTFTWRLAVPFLIYLISVAIIFLLKKIPILKHIVP